MNRQSYGLAPTLIANLPLEQAITLNYDELFEIASNDAGQPCAVIPGDEAPDAHRWSLKMHGNVADESTIVLTRTDYLGFDANRNVLAPSSKPASSRNAWYSSDSASETTTSIRSSTTFDRCRRSPSHDEPWH
ncbi:SIR2 family protein [Brevibacterium casei]|nr:SIR2 family protein [Brevibacterium casei]